MIDPSTMAIYVTEAYSNYSSFPRGTLYGQIDIAKFDGSKWNVVDNFVHDPPVIFPYTTDNYGFGRSLSTNQSLIFCTSADNMVHVLQWDGTQVVLLDQYVEADMNKNFAYAYGSQFFPQKILVFKNMMIINGHPEVTILKIDMSCSSGFVLNSNLTCIRVY